MTRRIVIILCMVIVGVLAFSVVGRADTIEGGCSDGGYCDGEFDSTFCHDTGTTTECSCSGSGIAYCSGGIQEDCGYSVLCAGADSCGCAVPIDPTTAPTACSVNADCDDSNSCTNNICENPGTATAYCDYPSNGSCTTSTPSIACSSISDCNDNDSCTDQACINPGLATSYCNYWCNGTCYSETCPEPNAPPSGYNDGQLPRSITSVYGWTYPSIIGWAYDPDVPAQSIDVHLYYGPRDDNTGAGCTNGCQGFAWIANVNRPGLPVAGDHGFVHPIPSLYLDGGLYRSRVYGINNVQPGANPLLPCSSTGQNYCDFQVFRCDNGLDDDGDGLTDWPADPCCTSASVNDEYCVPPNSAPAANTVTAIEPDYCLVGPAASVTWVYSDPENQPQSAYQVQVDDSTSFQSPVTDSGKVMSGATAYWTGQGLPYNTIYRARVRVWDSLDLVSAWTTMSQCNGPNCQGATSWRTPQHRYPSGISFSNTPTNPQVNEVVQFAGAASCYNNQDNPVACSVWRWTFGDGGTSSVQNSTHTYGTAGSYQATLQVQDAQGYTCPVPPYSKTLTIQIRIPKWREVLPR